MIHVLWVIGEVLLGIAVIIGVWSGLYFDSKNGLFKHKNNGQHRPEPGTRLGDFSAGFITDEVLHDLDDMFK